MERFKRILYYMSVILPILSKIRQIIDFFVEFNNTNKEVIQAREELSKMLADIRKENEEFLKIMED